MTIHRATLIDDRRVRRPGRAAAILAAAAGLLLVGATGTARAQEGQEGEQPEATGEESYRVDPGDTLWDLAAEFLSDPFEWKQIYELNRGKIDDPHWIYPGQRFLIPGRDGTVKAVTVREKEAGEEADRPAGEKGVDRGAEADRADRAAPGPGDPFDAPSIFDHNPEQGVTLGNMQLNRRRNPSLVSASDFYKASFVADWTQVGPRGTTTRLIRENPLGLEIPPSVRLRDRVVLALGGLDVSAGDTVQAVRPGRRLDDARIVQSLGLLEIRNVRGDSARAVVVSVYGDYREGDPVIPAETFISADRRSLRETDRSLRGRVLGLSVDQALVSTGDHLYLDVGSGSGVAVGDEFAIFPSTVENPAAARIEDRLGVARVVRVRGGTSTARVVETHDVGIEAGLGVLRVREPVAAGG